MKLIPESRLLSSGFVTAGVFRIPDASLSHIGGAGQHYAAESCQHAD